MRLVLLCALFLCSPAWAALSVTTGHFASGNPPGTCSISASVGGGQAIVVMEQGSTATSLTITDSVNTGNYSLGASYTSPATMAIFWMKTNASGTPAISVSGTTGFTSIWCFAITGYVGTPTFDTALVNTATGTSTTPTINATSGFNNEAMLVNVGKSYTQSVTATGWTAGTTGTESGFSGFYALEATSGTANNFSGSWGTSQTWYLLLGGIYDLPSGTCSNKATPSTGAAFAIPNGTSGSYQGKTGSFVTPNCSSMNFKCPLLGNFCVN